MKRARKPSRTRTHKPPKPPKLRFSPTAWAKLLFLRDLGDSEVGAFGVSAGDDLLLVERVELVTQEATCVTVCFEPITLTRWSTRGSPPSTVGLGRGRLPGAV